MFAIARDRLDNLIRTRQSSVLYGGLKGLEKESLRVTHRGHVAQTPHPRALGSPLTHPYITTDYSEALLEFITPPFQDSRDTLAFMQDLHTFTCQQLNQEILWATSMPCLVEGELSIPVAEYGSSNIGRMKHIYRLGLWHRYGRTMQAISGIHFNYSVPDALWPELQKMCRNSDPLNEFISEQYFSLIRNLRRMGWLVLYLFGASPALCKSFLCRRSVVFDSFDEYSYYLPYATSLRMSDIGYKNSTQSGIPVSYNSLAAYTNSLIQAIETPYPPYQELGIKDHEGYRQLNANLLQIENEYYSSARPKQLTEAYEKPILALQRRGVKYVELRSVDVGAFHPTGMDIDQLYFLEAFLLLCTLCDSSPIDAAESSSIDHNMAETALRGRQPGLCLRTPTGQTPLTTWAREICLEMSGICEALDEQVEGAPYSLALKRQMDKIDDPSSTPSAQILEQMRDQGLSFFEFALQRSENHQSYFNKSQLDPQRKRDFRHEAEKSIHRQTELEREPAKPFEAFLADYFAQ